MGLSVQDSSDSAQQFVTECLLVGLVRHVRLVVMIQRVDMRAD